MKSLNLSWICYSFAFRQYQYKTTLHEQLWNNHFVALSFIFLFDDKLPCTKVRISRPLDHEAILDLSLILFTILMSLDKKKKIRMQ